MKILTLKIGAILLVLIAGCSLDTPDAPPSDNPFDPENPETGGDPFKVQAQLENGAIRVTWRAVIHPTITGYSVYRNENASAFARIHAVSLGTTAYADTTIRSGYRYGYYVVGRFGDDEGDSSRLRIAYVNTSPALLIEGGVAQTPARSVTLTLVAFAAERMLLSNSEGFVGAVWEPFSPTKPWQLTTGYGTKRVYLKVAFGSGDTSEAVTDEIEPAELNPNLRILPDSLFINHTEVTLSMPNVGATEMMIADNPDGTGADWQPYQPEISWNLSPGDGWKKVYGWFRNDWYSASVPVLDSVGLDTRAEISSFTWSTSGGDTLYPGDVISFECTVRNDDFGVETGGTVLAVVDGWQPVLLLEDRFGIYTELFEIIRETPTIRGVYVIATFTDRAGNIANPVTYLWSLTVIARGYFSFTITEGNKSILIEDATIDGVSLTIGDEIGVFTPSNICAGAYIVTSEGFPVGLSAWGDDQGEAGINGFLDGEVMTFRIWDISARQELDADADVMEGEIIYERDAFTVVTLHSR